MQGKFSYFRSMSSREQKFTNSRVRTSYASVIISMTLVLFVLGLIGTLLLSAERLGKSVRENFTFTIVLDEAAPEEDLRQMLKMMQVQPYTKSATLISKDEAAEDLQAQLGEDFISFLGYNPLSHTIDLNLKASYVASADLEQLQAKLMEEEWVTKVLYDPDLIALVNNNIDKLSIILGSIALVLLLIALALINSSIRLTIYSKRFTLKTMQLVGATIGFIRRPYLITSLVLGTLSALLATGMLAVTGLLLKRYFEDFMVFVDLNSLLYAAIGMLIFGWIISGLSTVLSIRRYLKLRTNELYY